MSHSNAADSNPPEAISESSITADEVDGIDQSSSSDVEEVITSGSSGEYDRLRQRLLVLTLGASVAISALIAVFYPLNIVANYAIGAVVGLVYVRMLGRGVARVGAGGANTGSASRFGLFAALIIVATRVDSLEVLPIFLGFMTYKAALFIYAVQTLVPTRKSKAP